VQYVNTAVYCSVQYINTAVYCSVQYVNTAVYCSVQCVNTAVYCSVQYVNTAVYCSVQYVNTAVYCSVQYINTAVYCSVQYVNTAVYCFVQYVITAVYCSVQYVNTAVYCSASGTKLRLSFRRIVGHNRREGTGFYFQGVAVWLLIFFLEAFVKSVEDLIGVYRVIIIKVIISSCLFAYVETFHCFKMNTFFLELYSPHDVMQISEACRCSVRCCANFETCVLYWKERLCSLNLVLKSGIASNK